MKWKSVSSRELTILMLSWADCIECSRRVLHPSILPGKQAFCIQASPSRSKGLPQLPLCVDIVPFGSFFCVSGAFYNHLHLKSTSSPCFLISLQHSYSFFFFLSLSGCQHFKLNWDMGRAKMRGIVLLEYAQFCHQPVLWSIKN